MVSRQENGLKIGNKEFDVEFSAVSGEMISLKYKGEEMLLAGLQPNFWRPSIDNDVPSGLLSRCIGWKEPMKNSKLLKLDMQVEPDSSLVIVVADYYLQEQESAIQMTYHILGNGIVPTHRIDIPIPQQTFSDQHNSHAAPCPTKTYGHTPLLVSYAFRTGASPTEVYFRV